jgi:hypothetical protein
MARCRLVSGRRIGLARGRKVNGPSDGWCVPGIGQKGHARNDADIESPGGFSPPGRLKLRANQNLRRIKIMPGMVGFLRDLAHRCTSLARRCSDIGVSRELEGIGAEFMERRSSWITPVRISGGIKCGELRAAPFTSLFRNRSVRTTATILWSAIVAANPSPRAMALRWMTVQSQDCHAGHYITSVIYCSFEAFAAGSKWVDRENSARQLLCKRQLIVSGNTATRQRRCATSRYRWV